jgi:hypothetical protein
VPAYDPMQFDTLEEAVQMARHLTAGYAGVLAWSRDAGPNNGAYGPPTIQFQSGDVPNME